MLYRVSHRSGHVLIDSIGEESRGKERVTGNRGSGRREDLGVQVTPRNVGQNAYNVEAVSHRLDRGKIDGDVLESTVSERELCWYGQFSLFFLPESDCFENTFHGITNSSIVNFHRFSDRNSECLSYP